MYLFSDICANVLVLILLLVCEKSFSQLDRNFNPEVRILMKNDFKNRKLPFNQDQLLRISQEHKEVNSQNNISFLPIEDINVNKVKEPKFKALQSKNNVIKVGINRNNSQSSLKNILNNNIYKLNDNNIYKLNDNNIYKLNDNNIYKLNDNNRMNKILSNNDYQKDSDKIYQELFTNLLKNQFNRLNIMKPLNMHFKDENRKNPKLKNMKKIETVNKFENQDIKNNFQFEDFNNRKISSFSMPKNPEDINKIPFLESPSYQYPHLNNTEVKTPNNNTKDNTDNKIGAWSYLTTHPHLIIISTFVNLCLIGIFIFIVIYVMRLMLKRKNALVEDIPPETSKPLLNNCCLNLKKNIIPSKFKDNIEQGNVSNLSSASALEATDIPDGYWTRFRRLYSGRNESDSEVKQSLKDILNKNLTSSEVVTMPKSTHTIGTRVLTPTGSRHIDNMLIANEWDHSYYTQNLYQDSENFARLLNKNSARIFVYNDSGTFLFEGIEQRITNNSRSANNILKILNRCSP